MRGELEWAGACDGCQKILNRFFNFTMKVCRVERLIFSLLIEAIAPSRCAMAGIIMSPLPYLTPAMQKRPNTAPRRKRPPRYDDSL